ncbi:MAG: hypothetical protein JJE30_06220 [Desulfuromonadales bacterium]|nr:hypothetical protein [Desulfuromonadales bacterium]
MARHLLSSFTDLWMQHERLYLEVFSAALLKLAEQVPSLANEDAISEELCVLLNQVCFEMGKYRNVEVRVPVWERPIQPVVWEELKGGKIRKRPDFCCSCLNRFALSAEEHEISLHIECKQLGEPTSSSWVLNENYVKNGIKRFDSATHEYGKRAPSGLIIGYLVNMTPETVLAEVSGHQKKHLPDNPDIEFEFRGGKLFTSRHSLTRKYVIPERFDLVHLWADLRIS